MAPALIAPRANTGTVTAATNVSGAAVHPSGAVPTAQANATKNELSDRTDCAMTGSGDGGKGKSDPSCRGLNMPSTHDFVVVSVMGPHAGEDTAAIFQRKRDDTVMVGKTFWLVRSRKSRPEMVHALCRAATAKDCQVYCVLVTPASANGAEPTQVSAAASEYSSDRSAWQPMPTGLGPVTGLMTPGAFALIFDELDFEAKHPSLDLWDYAEYSDLSAPVVFRQGASTICAVRSSTRSHPARMKNNLRIVLAVGRLAPPYAVWLR